jgi:hypothetical protein
VLPSGERHELFDCPVNLLRERHWELLRQWSQYHVGRLWYPGTVGEQPSRYLRSMEVLEDEVGRIQAEQRKREQTSPQTVTR